LSRVAEASGAILGLSYPLLALSTGARAVYQLGFKSGVTDRVGPALSAVAATSYLVASVGFAVRKRSAWWVSVSVLVFETVMCLVVGSLSVVRPALVGRTVWRLFGIDYGFFPLVQPALGLLWLLWPTTRAAFGVRLGRSTPS
jgi:hypothetical protein